MAVSLMPTSASAASRSRCDGPEHVNAVALVAGVFATWRLTHLFVAEDGPWDIVARLRRIAGSGILGRTMDCFYCLSLWMALPIAFWVGEDWIARVVAWPALSGAALLLERAVPDRTSTRD
jgi:hypothetical protein